MSMQIKLHRVVIDKQDSSETIQVYVYYDKIINGEVWNQKDHGRLFIQNNSYYPGLDSDTDEEMAEYEALQTAVESR